MFMGFLDALKAFDRLKHSILFQKLIDRKVPGYITRILIYWYASQTMYVRWSGILSHGFHDKERPLSDAVNLIKLNSPNSP